MTNVNMDLAIKSNLNTEDLVLISYVERIVGELNCKEINYKQIIKDLPIIFNSSSENTNIKKIRNMLNKEGVKKFITRETKQLGRGKGATTIFYVNKNNIQKLNVKNIVK